MDSAGLGFGTLRREGNLSSVTFGNKQSDLNGSSLYMEENDSLSENISMSKRSRLRCIVLPDSKLKVFWDFLIVFLVLY